MLREKLFPTSQHRYSFKYVLTIPKIIYGFSCLTLVPPLQTLSLRGEGPGTGRNNGRESGLVVGSMNFRVRKVLALVTVGLLAPEHGQMPQLQPHPNSDLAALSINWY